MDIAKRSLPESVKNFFNIKDDALLDKMISDMENKNIGGRKSTDEFGVTTYDYTYSYGDEGPMSQTQWSEQQSLLDRLSEQQAFFSEDEAGEEDQFGGFDLSETPGEDTADVDGTGDVGTGGSPDSGGTDPDTDDDSGMSGFDDMGGWDAGYT